MARSTLLSPIGALGFYHRRVFLPVLTWDQAGRGGRRSITAKCAERDNLTTGVVSLRAGRLLVLKSNPCLAMLKADDTVLWAHRPPGSDFRGETNAFSVSADGTIVDFSLKQVDQSPLRFDLRALKLSDQWPADDRTRPPRQDGLRIEGWLDAYDPKLDGKPIELEEGEHSRSLAIHPDARRFVLGADWSLRAFDAEGKLLWNRQAPGIVWAVNITGDGRLVVAAYGDGTIRWHLAAARFDVQTATGAAVAPGARLHILAIGISDYGDKATNLRLKFAAKDANDVASALLATQGGEFNKRGAFMRTSNPNICTTRTPIELRFSGRSIR
jgi:hypothetical protein